MEKKNVTSLEMTSEKKTSKAQNLSEEKDQESDSDGMLASLEFSLLLS